MRRKLIAVLAILAVSLTGCGSGDSSEETQWWPEQTTEPYVFVQSVRVGDKVVPCVFWDPSVNGVAMDCDWEAAK